MGLSFLGIFHTLVGIIAIVSAIISFAKFGKVNLAHASGKIYFYGTLITAVTALGFTKHGFNPGHILSLLVIVLVVIAHFLFNKKSDSKSARYWENFCFSFSFFLSMLPTINETFTRIPVGHPIASGPTDPVITKTLLLVFVLFIAGSVYQFIRQRKMNKYL